MIEVNLSQLIAGVVGVLLSGCLSGFGGAWVAIRVMGKEIEWINKTLARHDSDIDRLHSKISSHVQHYHNPHGQPDGD